MSGFFKKLLGGKSVKDTAMGAAKAIGLDPDSECSSVCVCVGVCVGAGVRCV